MMQMDTNFLLLISGKRKTSAHLYKIKYIHRAVHELQGFIVTSDWFITVFVRVVIGQRRFLRIWFYDTYYRTA